MEIKSSADFMRMTRAALAAAGFVRMEADGLVWWENVGRASARPRRTEARPTLVLLHGVNDQAGTWFLVAPALAQNFRVILPDLPGHGESQPRSGPLPISMIVDRIASILPNEPFTLIGNSLGGWIAMLYTLRHPERVQTLILESSGGLDRQFAVPVIATNRDDANVILRAVHGPNYVAPEWVIDALLARATDSPMLRVTEIPEHYVDARLDEINVPTHIIWGADDGVVPLSYARELQRGIAGSELHVLEGAAHIPHAQQPQRFIQCLNSIS